MKRSTYIRLATVLSLAVLFGMGQSAQAFYLRIPDIFKTLPTSAAEGQGQFGDEQGFRPFSDNQGSGSQDTSRREPNQQGFGGEHPDQQGFQGSQGPQDQRSFDQQGQKGFQGQEGQRGQQGQQGFDGQQGSEGRQGPSDEEMDARRQKDEQRQMQDMKRGMKQAEMGLRNFESMIKSAEKKGSSIPEEMKQKVAQMRTILDAVKAAKTMEEMQAAGMEEFFELMQELEEFRREVFEKEQRLKQMQKEIRGMEQGIKHFDSQIKRLERQKVTVPQDVKDTLAKIKTIVAALKSAKTWEEIEDAGIEDLQELFQSLDESRQELEFLSRWPQTLKDVNRELNNLTRELKRAKGMVDRLLKKGIDLTSVYAEFEASVKGLQTVRDTAIQKVKEGNLEGAIQILENDFFGAMQDVWENHRIIMTMGNLGQFASEFKRRIAEGQRMIQQLKRQKIDTTELAAILNQANIKGKEILELLKQRPIDEEAIMAGIQELENIGQEFEDVADRLSGREEDRPWEKGQDSFKEVEFPGALQQFMPKKSEEAPRESNPSPAPLPEPTQ